MTVTSGAISHSVLSTVLDHCNSSIRGRDDDFFSLLYMYTAPPCVYKRGRWSLSSGSDFGRTQHSAPLTEHIRSSEPRYWHSPQSTPPLAETWELPSLSRLACTPYYRHPRCKTVQCSRTPLCWTYSPAAGTRINPYVTVLPLASTIWDEEHVASSLVGSGPPGQDTDSWRAR